ncbi:MAG: ROK family protein [Acidobacteria bacterium]|nr:ROK family protein [Acidobacteriota bacterium]
MAIRKSKKTPPTPAVEDVTQEATPSETVENAHAEAISSAPAEVAESAATATESTATETTGPKTLSVDIGGSGVKLMVLDENGKPLTERARQDTPQPAKPQPIVDVIVALANSQTVGFDRISVGFPGVVHGGVVYTAPNLDPDWRGYDLAGTLSQILGKPTRVANDADVQGFGAIEGKGLELVLTLGTGLGSALFIDGRLVPNLELAHHPFRNDCTYEEQLGRIALDKAGKKKWNKRVRKAIELLARIINYRALYIGGGNAKKLQGDLPTNVSTVSNEAGILGGIALWRY